MPEERLDRTSYLGLLALMIAAADAQNWSYPYWNVKQIDAAFAALADAPRDGTVPLANPGAAPTAALSASPGSIAGSIVLEVGQTFVDAYGRETAVGPLATVSTPAAIADPAVVATLGTPTLGGASGYEGGLLEVWYSWTDGAGGETLSSPVAHIDVPFQSGGLLSEVGVTLPSTPAAAGAKGANIYLRHRGGNTILGYRILVDSVAQITLAGAAADCYRSTPVMNSTGSVNAVDVTGVAPGDADAVLTRFYIRNQGDAWASSDQRLRLAGLDEWDPATIVYPLLYTGASGELTAGFPPTVSQVKAFRPLSLETEVLGTLPQGSLPAMVTLETELVKPIGDAVLSGLAVAATDPASMAVDVATGEAWLVAGRFTPEGATLVIPASDFANPRIDIICIAADGTLKGPTESASLKGAPAAAPVAPATPPGYQKLAEVLLDAGATSIAAGKVSDRRLVLTTLVTETAARLAADALNAGNLSSHAADGPLHSSKPYTFSVVNDDCEALSTSDFTIACTFDCLVTSVGLICTSSGSVDYDLEFFTDSNRTILAYKAEGVTAAAWKDLIPWEWFAASTFYGRITNNSADAISDLAITLKYRR